MLNFSKSAMGLVGAVATVICLSQGGPAAAAAVLYDQNVTPDVIFGSGNANGGWTVDRSGNAEVGLRAKLRFNSSGLPENTFNSNGDGTYSFDAISRPGVPGTAIWSFEWSINSDLGGGLRALNDLTYELRVDRDAGVGTDFLAFDPINGFNAGTGAVWWDHAIGNNSTANGGGTSATSESLYAGLIDSNNVAQNSWQPHWFFLIDPAVAGTYDFGLTAFDGDNIIAQTEMQVLVGGGASPVPVPAAALLFAPALIGGAWVARRRKQAAT